jgi:GNAT superfamily N-acetyltransferase
VTSTTLHRRTDEPPAAPRPRVRAALPADARTTARWQQEHLGHGFFPGLGRGFLARWHASYLAGPHGVSLVAEVDDGGGPVPVGFLVGSVDQVAHVRSVVDGPLRAGLVRAGVLGLLAHPRTAGRFVRTRGRRYARRLLGARAGAAPAPVAGGGPAAPVAVVAAVVVLPAARGAGVGAALLDTFLATARAAGTPTAELVTRADGGAAAFYEQLGWRRVADRTDRDGARVLTYALDLDDPAVHPAGDDRPAGSPRPVVARPARAAAA